MCISATMIAALSTALGAGATVYGLTQKPKAPAPMQTAKPPQIDPGRTRTRNAAAARTGGAGSDTLLTGGASLAKSTLLGQ